MREARPSRFGVAAVALGLILAVLSACSGGSAPADPASSTPTSASASPSPSSTEDLNLARIAVLSSDTGVLGSTGKGVRDSVALAVLQANALKAVPGWRFELEARNDDGTQAAGQQAASELAETEGVIGVVGTMRSTIDEGVQPILNSRGIPMVSPGGTAAQLTRRLDGTTFVRPFPTYFRLSPTDADQGRAGARFAAKRLDVRRVAVVSDTSSYGRLLAASFIAEAKRLKVKRPVVRSLPVPTDTPDEVAEIRRARAAEAVGRAGVDLVFFAGAADQAAGFAEALTAAGVDVPLMGGDALFDPAFLRQTGPLVAQGDLAVFPGAAATELATASTFVTAYQAAGFGDDPGPYGANAFDAAQALIRAFGEAVGPAVTVDAQVRAATVAALDGLRFEGVTGPVAFDAFGDAENPPLSLYRADEGSWRPAGVVRLG